METNAALGTMMVANDLSMTVTRNQIASLNDMLSGNVSKVDQIMGMPISCQPDGCTARCASVMMLQSSNQPGSDYGHSM